MKKIFTAIIFAWMATEAFADSSSVSALVGLHFTSEQANYLVKNGISIRNGNYINFANATPAATALPVLKLDTANNPFLNAITGKTVKLGVNGTSTVKVTATDMQFAIAGGQPQYPIAAIITPSTSFPTPNAGDTLTQVNSILAAGAPTAAFVELPAATANVGKTFTLFNQGSNPGGMVPISGDTVNVAAAATPFSCATGKKCDCTGLINSNWGCSGY